MYKIAVIGATGNVGHQTLQILAEREFPVETVYAVASDRSVGAKVSYGDTQVLTVTSLNTFNFQGLDLAFFCTESKISREFIPKAIEAGCKVIDKSSAFRLQDDVPLVVPEVNAKTLLTASKGVVANPNCTTIPLTLALKPLHEIYGVKRVVTSTYQSVSGAGKEAMDELFNQTRAIIVNQNIEPQYMPRQISFNVIPCIGSCEQDGDSEEETKMMLEIKKIVDPNLAIVATCVRVPVFIGHSMAVNVELAQPIASLRDVRNLFIRSSGLAVTDRPQQNSYATPIDVVGEDKAFISRMRIDATVASGLSFWLSCDNLRKGAALNAVQIAEHWLLGNNKSKS